MEAFAFNGELCGGSDALRLWVELIPSHSSYLDR